MKWILWWALLLVGMALVARVNFDEAAPADTTVSLPASELGVPDDRPGTTPGDTANPDHAIGSVPADLPRLTAVAPTATPKGTAGPATPTSPSATPPVSPAASDQPQLAAKPADHDAQPPTTTQPAEPSEPATTQPQTQPAEQPPQNAEQWLDRLEARWKDIDTLEAKLRWDRIQGLLGDEQRRFGSVIFRSGPPAQFAVHFDRLLADGRGRHQDRRYIFDGEVLVERLGDEKRFVRRRVVADADDPADADPLAMGQGPFVLPVKPDKERLLKRFDVKLIEGDAQADKGEDEPELVHLRLRPKRDEDRAYERIDLWYDRQRLLPVRAETVDAESESVSRIKLWDLTVNGPIDPEALSTDPPQGDDWEVIER